ncbi:MAG: nucleotidyltransferase domain-containing protein [Tepidisphaeraceae bacterium]
MKLTTVALTRIQKVARRYPVTRLALFGSRARGTANRQSDYDFLITLDHRQRPSLFDLGGLQYDLSEALNSPVDVLVYDDAIPERILRDAQPIFERR